MSAVATARFSADPMYTNRFESCTLQEFLKTYPKYEIKEEADLNKALSVQWIRHWMMTGNPGAKVEDIPKATQFIVRYLIPYFLKEICSDQPEALLNDSVEKQVKVADMSCMILNTKPIFFMTEEAHKLSEDPEQEDEL